jgi:hypothetical protein
MVDIQSIIISNYINKKTVIMILKETKHHSFQVKNGALLSEVRYVNFWLRDMSKKGEAY